MSWLRDSRWVDNLELKTYNFFCNIGSTAFFCNIGPTAAWPCYPSRPSTSDESEEGRMATRRLLLAVVSLALALPVQQEGGQFLST